MNVEIVLAVYATFACGEVGQISFDDLNDRHLAIAKTGYLRRLQ